MNKRESVEERLSACERLIGYYFSEPSLLEAALTHSSLRAPDRECNERLEFLGDSVLGLVITEELYRLLPDQSEGELTRIKSAVVSRSALHTTSTRLGLARYAEFARGVGKRDALPASVVANLVESIIGAIYLDAGYYPAREFVLRHLGDELEKELDDRGAKNYKSLLQHEVQQAISVTPTYRTIEEGGPDHEKAFTVAAIIRGREWGRAKGSTKKEAEQDAARQALEAWERRGRSRRRRRRGADSDAVEQAAPAATSTRGEATPREEATSRDEATGPRLRKRRRRSRDPESTPEPAAAPPADRGDEGHGVRKRRRRPRRSDTAPASDEVPAETRAEPEARPARKRRASRPERAERAPAERAERAPRERVEREERAPKARAERAPRERAEQVPAEREEPVAAKPEAPADEAFAVGLELEEMLRDRKPRRRTKRAGGKPAPVPRVKSPDPVSDREERAPEPVRESRPAPAPAAVEKPAAKPEEKPADDWDADGFGMGILDAEPKKKTPKPEKKASKSRAKKAAARPTVRKRVKTTDEPAAKKAPAKAAPKRKAAKKSAKAAPKKSAKSAAKPAKKAAKKKAAKKKAAKSRARPKSEDGFAAGLL